METKLENRKEPMAPAGAKVNPQPHIKRIGPHVHEWTFYAVGSDGARYETCALCFARRVVDRSLLNALHIDWINGVGEWDPAEDKLNPPAAARDKAAEAKILADNKAADEKAAKRREERAELQAEQDQVMPTAPLVAAVKPQQSDKSRS